MGSKGREKLSCVKGTRDILPPRSDLWRAVESEVFAIFDRYGYSEIRNPIIEPSELFIRSIGEGTDIVNKEMYIFNDKKGRSICLRPEGTASVARAYVEHGMHTLPHPIRMYYHGPMFRYERPQKGRYRQFYQLGAEILGSESPLADVEIMTMIRDFLSALDFTDLQVLLNSVGCEECRPGYRKVLVEKLSVVSGSLCSDCRDRIESNPLRVFDCKVPSCRALVADLPLIAAHLCETCSDHHSSTLKGLTEAGVDYRIEEKLVRGLDYYTKTVFEVVSDSLGAQNAILGGGRYNRLIEDLGGPKTPAVGFALGEDRLIEILPESCSGRVLERVTYYILPFGEAAFNKASDLAGKIRAAGRKAVMEIDGRSFKAAMKFADRQGFSHVVILGEDELEKESVSVKTMATSEQELITEEQFLAVIKN